MAIYSWHHFVDERILEPLDTRLDTGLDTLEAEASLTKYGPNTCFRSSERAG
jgi:Cation transporter/ATPase, N-terminus